MAGLRVLSAASEAVPLVKTGGLADVAGALPAALAPHGVQVTTLLPAYPAVLAAAPAARAVHRWEALLGEPARLLAAEAGGHPFLLLDAPSLYARAGGPYAGPEGADFADNWRRFAAFARAAADLILGAAPALRFDLLHAHDWQAGLAPAYLRYAPGAETPPPSILTVHNIAFQGRFEADIFPALGLPPDAYGLEGIEYFGGVGYLKAGLASASAITTVSPTYAAEIRTPAFGMGLEGLIDTRAGVLHGIVNGIDAGAWDPASDPALAQTYDAASLPGRAANKRAVEAAFGLEPSTGPLFIVVSRLTRQKGMDLLAAALPRLLDAGGRLALLGSGDRDLEGALAAAALRAPGRIGVRLGYDEALSHRMQGGGDAILIPSRFEPCGLTQLYGLRYGCVPVVARTGGLADTVIDANVAALSSGVATGLHHAPGSADALGEAIARAAALFADPPTWGALQRNGMAANWGWAKSGAAYARLYRGLTGGA